VECLTFFQIDKVPGAKPSLAAMLVLHKTLPQRAADVNQES